MVETRDTRGDAIALGIPAYTILYGTYESEPDR